MKKKRDAWINFSAGPGRHHETYEGDSCLLPELGILGWLRFSEAFRRALEPDSHQNEIEIHYIVSGELSWWVENSTYEMRSGMVLIVAPGELHGSSTGVLEPCEHFWLRLSVRDGEKLPGLTSAQTNALIAPLLSLAGRLFHVSQEIPEQFGKLIGEHRRRDSHSQLTSRSALHILLTTLLRECNQTDTNTEGQSAKVPIAIQKCQKEIHQNLSDPPSVERLSKIAFMSESAFRKTFLEVAGCSPHDYITRRRIQEAQHLLSAGNMSITDVAFELGFSSSQYFSTVFKRITGESPSSYQKN